MHVVPWYSYSNCNRCTVTYVNLCTCCKCPPALAAAPLLKTYSTHQARGIGNANIHVMEWSGRRTGHRQRSLSKMETTAGGGGRQVLLYSSRQFSARPKSSLARIDKRAARAARNTRCRYYKIGPLDHKMADNCVSLACTNTLSSTITKLIKT